MAHPSPDSLLSAALPWSRQSTVESTAASVNDDYLPLSSLDHRRHLLQDGKRSLLPTLTERRGWKHTFRYVLSVPLAFVGGLLLGVLATTAYINARFELVYAGAAPSSFVEPYAMVPPPHEVPPEYLAAQPLNNSCIVPKLVVPLGPQSLDACDFVVRSTDEVWNLRGDVEAAIEKYFHDGYLDAGSWGKRIVGISALKDAVFSQMRAFPDIKIHITDCSCKGNDIDGYKCAMADTLQGTNLGPSAYGPATGNPAIWTGLIQSLVKWNPIKGQWQYYAEWGVHDEWSLIQQLGLDFRRVPRPGWNMEQFHDCTPIQMFGPGVVLDTMDMALMSASGYTISGI
eukprot:TRINITY_DN880_c0_g2_i2.p1 TRINITY_DN880_c0_g2~~TRINITY_DN880_c0_g2_i2.p1  ORF type:complete len:342 (-),score=45.64 TRINITY_DN880_c0_g2_i2:468-1493(-)